jgi:hypothetical protein
MGAHRQDEAEPGTSERCVHGATLPGVAGASTNKMAAHQSIQNL